VLSRCQLLDNDRRRWKARFDTSLTPDITVAVRLDETNQAPLDCYLLPRLDFGQSGIHLVNPNGFEFESYRFGSLDYLYGMTRPHHAADLQMIPVDQIAVLNPRDHNGRVFEEIVGNIKKECGLLARPSLDRGAIPPVAGRSAGPVRRRERQAGPQLPSASEPEGTIGKNNRNGQAT